jgi:hypothetical protein
VLQDAVSTGTNSSNPTSLAVLKSVSQGPVGSWTNCSSPVIYQVNAFTLEQTTVVCTHGGDVDDFMW